MHPAEWNQTCLKLWEISHWQVNCFTLGKVKCSPQLSRLFTSLKRKKILNLYSRWSQCLDGRILLWVVLRGLSGHRAMKGLRRERGECVVLRFIFHYCQPFVMTLASADGTYVALGLNMCVRMWTCMCALYTVCEWGKGSALRSKRKNTWKLHQDYFHLLCFLCWTWVLRI